MIKKIPAYRDVPRRSIPVTPGLRSALSLMDLTLLIASGDPIYQNVSTGRAVPRLKQFLENKYQINITKSKSDLSFPSGAFIHLRDYHIQGGEKGKEAYTYFAHYKKMTIKTFREGYGLLCGDIWIT